MHKKIREFAIIGKLSFLGLIIRKFLNITKKRLQYKWKVNKYEVIWMKRKWLGLVLFFIVMISFGCGPKQTNERIQATNQQGVYTVQLKEKEGFVVKIEDKKAVEIAKDKYPTAMKLQLSIKVDKNGYEIKLKDKKSDIGATSRLKLDKSYQYAAFVANKDKFPEKLGSMIFTNDKKIYQKAQKSVSELSDSQAAQAKIFSVTTK